MSNIDKIACALRKVRANQPQVTLEQARSQARIVSDAERAGRQHRSASGKFTPSRTPKYLSGMLERKEKRGKTATTRKKQAVKDMVRLCQTCLNEKATVGIHCDQCSLAWRIAGSHGLPEHHPEPWQGRSVD